MIRGLPIPVIFLRDQRSDLSSLEPKREVVDGQQRIRTVLGYIDPELLEDFREAHDAFVVSPVHNRDVGGCSFGSLPKEYQQRILDYEFSVHVLSSAVDDRDVLGLFARMNSTGVKLNDQELRNAEHFGAFKTSMFEIATTHLPRWRAWGVATENDIARMQEVELSSEFAIMMLNGVTAKRKKLIDDTYEEFDDQYPHRDEIEHRFHTVMDTIDDKLGSKVVSSLFRQKTLFYGLFVAVYDLQFGLGSPLDPTKTRILSDASINKVISAGEKIRAHAAPDKVMQSVTRRTTNEIERTNVFTYVKQGELDG